jgi:SAM-dependent methyltransferase
LKPLFDEVAEKFAGATDRVIEQNTYLRGKLIVDLAQRWVPARGEVLDYGCGPGRLSVWLARCGFRVRGADISERMIAQARALDSQGLDVSFETIAAAEDVLQPETCDAVLCSSVIEYVPDPDALLQGFRRALRRPGTLIISYANKSSLWRRHWDRAARKENPMYSPHNHVWHWRGFKSLLVRNGFETVCGPQFFESPWDWRPWGPLCRYVPFVGTLGVLVARPAAMPARAAG